MNLAAAPVVERACRRNTCDEPARVSLVFDYLRAQAWLIDLVEEPHPLRWDLCPVHADTLSVPRGWELIDDRSERTAAPAPSPVAPREAPAVASPEAPPKASADAVAEVGGGEEVPAGVTREPSGTLLLTKPSPRPRGAPSLDPHSRYAPLLRALPRLAAEHAARQHQAARGLEPGAPPGEAVGPGGGVHTGADAHPGGDSRAHPGSDGQPPSVSAPAGGEPGPPTAS